MDPAQESHHGGTMKSKLLPTAITLAALGLVGCSQPSPDTSAEQPPTESAATTSTTTPSPTSSPEEEVELLKGWAFKPGDQPTFKADGITTRITGIQVVPADLSVTNGDQCLDAFALQDARSSTGNEEECLLVQMSYDVAKDLRTSKYSTDGGLSMRAVITPQGKQINSVMGFSAYPGTKDNWASDVFAGAGAGATLKFSTGNNEVGWTDHTYTVPKKPEDIGWIPE